jgi:hypothetical protein
MGSQFPLHQLHYGAFGAITPGFRLFSFPPRECHRQSIPRMRITRRGLV